MWGVICFSLPPPSVPGTPAVLCRKAGELPVSELGVGPTGERGPSEEGLHVAPVPSTLIRPPPLSTDEGLEPQMRKRGPAARSWQVQPSRSPANIPHRPAHFVPSCPRAGGHCQRRRDAGPAWQRASQQQASAEVEPSACSSTQWATNLRDRYYRIRDCSGRTQPLWTLCEMRAKVPSGRAFAESPQQPWRCAGTFLGNISFDPRTTQAGEFH